MEDSKKFNTFWLIGLMVIPFIYLAMIWPTLPDTVPIHFDIRGKADGFGSKNMLIWLPALMMVPTFIIFLLIPIIDPKNKIASMGNSFEKIKFVTIGLLSALSIFIIHSSAAGGNMEPKFLYALLGIFFMAIGNYLPTIKPNYFMGIRTPWTLENETVWRKTHRLGGRFFMIGGFLVAIGSLLVSNEIAFGLMMTFALGSVVVLFIYSYLEFKKL